MNKKLFLGMFAAAGMLLATSCSNDELDVVQSGNEAQVSFSLGLEGGIATRAISDGKSADVLMYAVFDKYGNRINTIQKVSKTKVTFPTTESITLAKGQTYKVAFWAQDDDCEAYTVDTDKMSVVVNYANDENKVNNDETRDAFFKTVEFTVTGSTSIDVEMKRPFAQINVGVTKEDWEAAVASGIEIGSSSVVIKNAATSLNLLDGTVNGSTEVSYALNAIPNDPAILKVDANGDGEDEEYNWLSMSYILPAAEQTGYEKATLENIAFVFAPKNNSYSNIEFNQGLNSVPVQRNWRTNILGKLLTGDITFNIVIDPVYEDDHNVNVPYATINGVVYTSFAEAMAAVQDGETIKLEGETALGATAGEHLFTIDNKNVTIDLNGYGIVANIPDVSVSTAIFHVKPNSGLTIVGDGNVKVTTAKSWPNAYAAFIENDGGEVNLKGGNWTMTALEYSQESLCPLFVDNNSNLNSATLNIYNGTYTFHRNLFRNFANAAGHNNYATVATINIYGGTFNGREGDAGAIWNQKPSSTTPDGAGVINVMGGIFNNVVINNDFAENNSDAPTYLTVTTADELTQAIANATADVTIFLGDNITGNATAVQKENVKVTIIGNQKTYNGAIIVDGKSKRYATAGLTIQNISFSAENISEPAYINLGKSGNGNTRYTNNVTVKDCTFSTTSTKDVAAVKSYTGGDWNLNISGCTVNEGMHSMLQVANVEKGLNIAGCKVYSKNGINLNNTPSLEMEGCTFDTKGYAIRVGVNGNTNNGVFNISNSTLKSDCEDDDAVIILRGNMAGSTLNLTNTTVTGTLQYTNESNATINVM